MVNFFEKEESSFGGGLKFCVGGKKLGWAEVMVSLDAVKLNFFALKCIALESLMSIHRRGWGSAGAA